MSTRVGLAVIGLACTVAAGTGGYLATRQANQPAAAATVASTPQPAPSAAVHETEAVIEEPKPATVPATEGSVAPGLAAPTVDVREGSTAPAPATASPLPRRATSARASKAPARDTARQPQAARRTTIDEPSARSTQAPGPEPREAPAPAPVDPLPAPETTERSEPVDVARERAGDPEPRFEELVVPGDSVLGLQIESTISSETARVEDRVDARVTRDVAVHGRVAVPEGTRVLGAVTVVDRGGKMRERARLGVRFHTIVLADGATLPLQTETIFREGDSPSSSSSAKIGGAAIGGALLGAIIGGARGAVIGGTTGAAGGTAAVMAGGRKPAVLSAGSTMTVRVLSPVSVTVERE